MPSYLRQDYKSPRRMASFLYCIINPVLLFLETEMSILQQRYLSWCSIRDDMDGTGEACHNVPGFYANTENHFRREFPAIKNSFNRHDSLVTDLLRSCRELSAKITGDKEFLDLVLKKVAKYEEQRLVDLAIPAINCPKNDVPGVVSDYLINNFQVDVHPFCKERGDLLDYYNGKHEREVNHISQVRTELLSLVRNLITELEDLSWEICTTYDLPADTKEE